MSATKTTTRTKAGKCPVHGDVQGEKDFPVASWPIVATSGAGLRLNSSRITVHSAGNRLRDPSPPRVNTRRLAGRAARGPNG